MSLHLAKALLAVVGPVLAHAALEDGALEAALILRELGIRLGEDVDGRPPRAALRGEGRGDGIVVHGVCGGEHDGCSEERKKRLAQEIGCRG